MRKIRVFSVGNKTLGFEEADVADEDKTVIVPEGPLADSMHNALLDVYSTDSKEKVKVNNVEEVEELASSLESQQIDSTLLTAMTDNSLGIRPKKQYTTLFGLNRSNLSRKQTIVDVNDALVNRMKDPRCVSFNVLINQDDSGGKVPIENIRALRIVLEAYGGRIYDDFGEAVKDLSVKR